MTERLHGCSVCEPLPWGEPWEIGSAAFWVEIASSHSGQPQLAIGASLREEIAACLLGGFRVRGDVGVSAFHALVKSGVLDDTPVAASEIQQVLSAPLRLSGGAMAKYPFPNQRAQRLADALAILSHWDLDDLRCDARNAQRIRDALCELPGVGPKTASWIVRNHWGSDSVAIIDVHLQRAGIAAGLFCPSWRLPAHYGRFEAAFLSWAQRGRVRASSLDIAIWTTLAGGRRSALVDPPPAVRSSITAWTRQSVAAASA